MMARWNSGTGCSLVLGALLVAQAGTLPLSAQREWVVTGRLTGTATGWNGSVMAVPVLRIGAIVGDRGAFRLRGTAPAGCYEAIIRTGQRHVTHLRFSAPDSGVSDLGQIPIAELPYEVYPDGSPPAQHDTIGSCQPRQVSDDLHWLAAHATVTGRLLRGKRPLAKVAVDLTCLYQGSIRTETDSTGTFRFDFQLFFPLSLGLAEGGWAPCTQWIASPTLDEPRSFSVRFGPPSDPAPVTSMPWTLPEPDLGHRSVLGVFASRDAPLRLPGTISFSPGPFPAPQAVSLEFTDPPARPSFRWPGFQARDTTAREVLPTAMRVTTGHQLSGTGSDFILAVPEPIAARADSGDRLEAWVRLPLRYQAGPEAYFRLPGFYWSPLGTLKFSLVAENFDDARTPDHSYEALVIWTLQRR